MFKYKFYSDERRNEMLTLRIYNKTSRAHLTLGINMSAIELEKVLNPQFKMGDKRYRAIIWNFIQIIEDVKLELYEQRRFYESARVIRDIIEERFFGGSAVKERHRNERKGEFVKWYNKFNDTHRIDCGTREIYNYTLNKLREFNPNVDELCFDDINVTWLEDFYTFLAKSCKMNTRHLHMRNIRAVFKYAIRHDVETKNPFDKIKLKTEPTLKRSLNVKELRDIINMPVGPSECLYRDMFTLTFMLIGINPIDLFRLEKVNSRGRIEYIRAKTNKPYSIKVEPEAQFIIGKYKGEKRLLMLADRWVLEDSFSRTTNKFLKQMGDYKYEEISLYWARHTWATIAADLDIPDDTIALALGHSCANKTTDIYIRRNMRKIDEANRKVLDYVLYDKR